MGHDPYQALRYQNFRLYSAANSLSIFGRHMLNLAVTWEVYEITRSAIALGFLGLIQVIPLFVFALPAGHWADRFNRKRIVIFALLVNSVLSLSLGLVSLNRGNLSENGILSGISGALASALSGFERHADTGGVNLADPSLSLIYLIVLLMALFKIAADPSRHAMIPRLLPLEAFPNAVTWNRTIFQVAKTVGPVAGGFMVAYLDFSVVYVLNAAFGVIIVALFACISYSFESTSGKRSATVRELFAGVRYVHQTKAVLGVMTLDMFAALVGGIETLLPIFADRILHVGAVGLGWLRASEGLGAFAAALYLAHRPPLRNPGRVILWSVALFSGSVFLFGVSGSMGLSLFVLFLLGAFENVGSVVRQSVVYLMTPDSVRGRVSAVTQVFRGFARHLGAMRAGVVAALIGPVPTVLCGAVGTLVVVGVVRRLWPEVASIGNLAGLRAKNVEEESR